MLGVYLFVAHSLTAARPFFDLRMFLDRNFVVGLVLMAVFGLLVFVPMVLIPTMLERLRGFPVLMIGLLLAPRGLGTMLAMIVCGRLVTPGRSAPAAGAGLRRPGHVDLDDVAVQPRHRRRARCSGRRLLQGFGVGMMFVPLTMITFATLPVDLRTDGSALFHLLRNIGSSIGISLAVTYPDPLDPAQPRRARRVRLAASTRCCGPGLGDWDLSSMGGLLAIEPRDQPPGGDDRLCQRLPRHDPARVRGACR